VNEAVRSTLVVDLDPLQTKAKAKEVFAKMIEFFETYEGEEFKLATGLVLTGRDGA
jgi:hypothetical protein